MEQQAELFENASALPPGFRYEPEFLTRAEEGGLLAIIPTFALARVNDAPDALRGGQIDGAAGSDPTATNSSDRAGSGLARF